MYLANFLAEVTLEEVFKSTQQNMTATPGSGKLLGFLLGAFAIVMLLVLLQMRRKQDAIPKAVNHQGRLLKEMLKAMPLKAAEIKQLKDLAADTECTSPLTLLLCPSLLQKAVAGRDEGQREAVDKILEKVGHDAELSFGKKLG